MNKQQKERIFELLKEIHAVAKEADPKINWAFLNIKNEEKVERHFNIFIYDGEDGKSATTISCFREEKEKDAADQS